MSLRFRGCLLPQHNLAYPHWYNSSAKLNTADQSFLWKTLIFHCFLWYHIFPSYIFLFIHLINSCQGSVPSLSLISMASMIIYKEITFQCLPLDLKINKYKRTHSLPFSPSHTHTGNFISNCLTRKFYYST